MNENIKRGLGTGIIAIFLVVLLGMLVRAATTDIFFFAGGVFVGNFIYNVFIRKYI